MRKFLPGQNVRIERNATIIEQLPNNQYWYRVQLPDGSEETINIGRISAVADEARASIDLDGSVLVLTNRLSLEGAKSLLDWLSCHIETFDEQAYEVARSGACNNPQPPDGA